MKLLMSFVVTIMLVGPFSCYAGPTYILKPPGFPFSMGPLPLVWSHCEKYCEDADPNRRCVIAAYGDKRLHSPQFMRYLLVGRVKCPDLE